MRLRFDFVTAVCGGARRRRVAGLLLLVAALGPVASCKLFDSTCTATDRSCLGGGEARSGQVCIRTGDCAVGLNCVNNVCTYQGSTQRGDMCVASPECADGLYCSVMDLQCRPLSADPQPQGATCGSSADCQRGLVCDVNVAQLFEAGPYSLIPESCREQQQTDDTSDACTLPRRCVERGKVDIGGACKNSDDCVAGLFCIPNPLDTANNICFGGTKLPIEPVSVPLWGGVQCPADSADPVAYFEVPKPNVKEQDFYRLPFPNDIRRSAGGIDLSSHPSPPESLDPPAAHRFIEAAKTLDGFATNPVVFFRFSQPYRNDDRSATTMRIVDITPDSPDYQHPSALFWGPSERRSNYICPHWLSMHRPFDTPLRPNTTYAAIVTTGLRTSKAQNYARGPDFEAMLKSEKPADAALAKAWETYAPLRAYLADAGTDLKPADVLTAAVFTTQDPIAIIPKLRAAVSAEGAAELRDMTVCDSDIKSPCEDASGRGKCQPKNDDFIEIHGHVLLPAFQRGTAPYAEPQDGGEIALDAGGTPEIQGHASVCFALAVPRKAAPEAGFPLLLVAHGTGGSFADQMQPGGLAGWAATAMAPDAPSALLAIDMPSHGSRRGDSTREPQDLFFNFTNPPAARGNAIQGAADLIGLTLLAAETISASDSPTATEIRFDPKRVVLYAHSQGSTHAALMIGSEPGIRAAVLSGIGGHLATSLLEKKKPIDMSGILPFALFDPDASNGKLVGGDVNPMLALLQSYMESADPLNYASQLVVLPPASAPTGHDIFMTYGLFDSFAPEDTQQHYAKAGALPAVDPDLAVTFNEIASPAYGNVTVGSTEHTVALRTYDPRADASDPNAPQDGHFVATATLRGLADTRRFLSGALRGQLPQIGQ